MEIIRVAGCRLRVMRIRADKKSPVLVFLHEGLGCIELWRDFPQQLCDITGLPGLIYDRRGYGGSDKFTGAWDKDYLEKEAICLSEVLNTYDIQDAVLIGHSDGGSVALIAAALYGRLIRAVITEAAHIFVEKITIEGILRAVEAFKTTNLKEKLARYHHNNTETVFRRWADTWLAPEFSDWNIEKYLTRIICPLLILQGEDDEYGTVAQMDGIAGAVSGPAQKTLIPGCGHVPHVQAREKVMEEMRQFIDFRGRRYEFSQ